MLILLMLAGEQTSAAQAAPKPSAFVMAQAKSLLELGLLWESDISDTSSDFMYSAAWGLVF